jgi:MraZ protein
MANFKGEFRYTIDEKGRINIPAKFRKLLAPGANETFVITQGPEKCLDVYPLDEWEKTVESRLRALSPNKRAHRFYMRTVMSKASEAQYDVQGRIGLPANLTEYAGIRKDVVIVGVLDKIEVWAAEQYDAYYQNAGMTLEDVMESLPDGPHTGETEA